MNCFKCEKSSDDNSAGKDWIACDCCTSKFHRACVNMTVKTFKCIDNFPTENLKWFCDVCTGGNNLFKSIEVDDSEGENSNKYLIAAVKSQATQIESLNTVGCGPLGANPPPPGDFMPLCFSHRGC